MERHTLERLAQIKTAGFILKPDSPEIKPLYEEIKREFEDKGIRVLLSQHSAEMIGCKGITFDEMCKTSDFLVSLGGDGTLLSLVRRSYEYRKPVLGINAGNLGFLADITIEEVEEFLEQLLAGEYRVDERMMIEGYIRKSSGEQKKFFAFNDVVISRPVISKMAQINAAIDGEMFNSYKGDGLIVATPTGSTAYNLASGGPVMYPLTEAFILTPIMAHSLTQRPLVVPADFTLELSSPDEKVIAMIDGQDAYEIFEGDVLVIKGAKRGARLLHRKERNYFSVLREKLSWGDKH
ncbi:NAD(+)/NADH kinase [Sulfurovum mangrovi]|uniref:NAD(+)/NADH kinase n=1 Tax=Sulfurovum mangrovi TaxID=2893889 RepID=UPI001E547D63|nr:NAD(+)/NADH kinase [Sulfurovum mangrovi]UFH60282.1 NAD(+)/NADH kinase [Sulfurovum mangrovi]